VKFVAIKGGPMAPGVLLHISGQNRPIPLMIKATVKNDTIIEPAELVWGDIPVGTPPQVRPLRIVHYGDKETGFRLQRVTSKVPFVIPESLPVPRITQVDANTLKYQYDLKIAVDPNKSEPNAFMNQLAVEAATAAGPLLFQIPCRGTILPMVVPRPSSIIRIQKSLPEEMQYQVDLQPQIDVAVVVEDVTVDGLNIENWTQEPQRKSTLLTVRLRRVTRDTKVTGICHVTLMYPPGAKIDIPICLVELKTNVAAP